MAALQLEIQLATAKLPGQLITPDQRGITFAYGENRRLWRQWQIISVLKQNPFFQC
jgi:hypothetical protein